MEWILKLTSAVMISVLIIVLLEKPAPVNALLLSIAVTVLIALVSISFLEPVLSFLRRLEQICGVSTVYTGLMIKCLLISLVSRLGVSFCKDAGRGGMASMLELSGILASAWTAIPLLEAFLSMLEEMI